MSAPRRIFLSAANEEFRTLREKLAAALQRSGMDVEHEQIFPQTTEHTGRKLGNMIKDSPLLIHLVGHIPGSIAEEEVVTDLLAHIPDDQFLAKRPALRETLGDLSGLTYTQWEALLALHHGVPLLIYVPSDACQPESKIVRDDFIQKAHLDRLLLANRHPVHFKDETDFLAKVLPDVHRHFGSATPKSKINTLPQRSLGTLFKGREDFLGKLRSTLAGGRGKAAAIVQSHGVRPTAISALGGVGKTRTAIEYAWHHEEDYDALLFISGTNPQTLKDQIAALSNVLEPELRDILGTDLKKQYAAAIQWLETNSRWLLIIDNVDSDDSFKAATALLPRLSRGHVCITTRQSNWPASVQSLDLESLTEEAGADYLLEATYGRRTRADDDELRARALSQRLDGLALALEHAAAYIGKLRLGLRDYLEKLETNTEAVLEWHDDSLVQYPKSVAETWLLTFERLTQDEQHMLNTLAWFAAAPIPRGLVGAADESDSPPDSRELLAGLAAWHLITWSDDGQTFKVHRLVQDVTRARLLGSSLASPSLKLAIAWIRQANLGDSQDSATWKQWTPAAPHVLRIADHAKRQGDHHVAIQFKSDLAQLLHHQAQFKEALALFRETLELGDIHLTDHDELLSTVLHDYAFLLSDMGNYEEAEPLARRALFVGELAVGADHPTVGICLTVLAAILRSTNRLAEAEPLYRRALEIDEVVFGPDHPNLAFRLNNMAVFLKTAGRPADAEPFTRRALEIDERHFGPEHENVARDLNNLGTLQRAFGNYAEAETHYLRALSIFEKLLGSYHPNVAVVSSHLGALFYDLDRGEDALAAIRRAVSIYTRHGYEHAGFAKARERMKRIEERYGQNSRVECPRQDPPQAATDSTMPI